MQFYSLLLIGFTALHQVAIAEDLDGPKAVGPGPKNSIPIRQIEMLTLQRESMTKGRRSEPVKQLTCQGEYCLYAPSPVRCYNSGWDGIDVQWDCKAELDNKVKFGTLDVNCEGYYYPDDPNILAGSCGLKYTLDPASDEVKYNRPEQHHKNPDISKGLVDLVVGFLLFMIIIMFIMDEITKHPESPTISPRNSIFII